MKSRCYKGHTGLEWAWSPVTDTLLRMSCEDTMELRQTWGKLPCADGSRDWSHATTSQGAPRIAGKRQNLEKDKEDLVSSWPCRHLDFRLLASRLLFFSFWWEDKFQSLGATKCVVLCYSYPSKLIQPQMLHRKSLCQRQKFSVAKTWDNFPVLIIWSLSNALDEIDALDEITTCPWNSSAFDLWAHSLLVSSYLSGYSSPTFSSKSALQTLFRIFILVTYFQCSMLTEPKYT